MKLDVRLCQYKDHNKVVGSIESYSEKILDSWLEAMIMNICIQENMYSRNTHQFFESTLMGIIIFDYEHRSKDDPEFRKLLKQVMVH